AEVEQGAATRAPLDLAAGGPHHRAAPDEHDRVDRQVEALGDRAPHAAHDLVAVRVAAGLDALHDREALLARDLDRERGSAAGDRRAVGALGDQLDVLRVVVLAADDDDVLEPAGDEELIAVEEA